MLGTTNQTVFMHHLLAQYIYTLFLLPTSYSKDPSVDWFSDLFLWSVWLNFRLCGFFMIIFNIIKIYFHFIDVYYTIYTIQYIPVSKGKFHHRLRVLGLYNPIISRCGGCPLSAKVFATINHGGGSVESHHVS